MLPYRLPKPSDSIRNPAPDYISHHSHVQPSLPGTMIKVPATDRRLTPVQNPRQALLREYGDDLTSSDLRCLCMLVDQKKLDVMLDRDTRSLTLVPKPEVEGVLGAIFGISLDED